MFQTSKFFGEKYSQPSIEMLRRRTRIKEKKPLEAAPKVDVVVDETLLLLARENVRLTGEEVVRKQKKLKYMYICWRVI